MFCPNCGSMMFPRDGMLTCGCGYSEGIKSAKTIKTDITKRSTVIQSSNDPTLPKTRVVCPECGFTEATVTVRQTRAADEPETMIYRCCNPKCNHTWRQN